LLGALKVTTGKLWGWASVFMGAQLGNLEFGSSTGDFEIGLKRALGLECGSSVKRIWREGFLAGDPEIYVEKALETGISFHRGSVLGKLEEGLSSGDSES
jgi:hypothetical protein